jgi:hypothetical protein
LRRHQAGETAEIVGRDVHAEGRSGLIGGKERVAGADEGKEFEGAAPEHPTARGGLNDSAQPGPFVDKNEADGIGTGVGLRLGQGGDEAIAAIEQEVEELIAKLLVGDRAGELLDREDDEGVPVVEGGLPCGELGGSKRRGGCGRRRSDGGRNVQLERELEAVVVGNDGRQRAHRSERGLDARDSVGIGGSLHQIAELAQRLAEVIGEVLEARSEMALDEIETVKQDGFLVRGVVEVEVDDVELDGEIGADVGRGIDLDDAGPGDRRDAFAVDGKAEAEIGIHRKDEGAILLREARIGRVKILALVGPGP